MSVWELLGVRHFAQASMGSAPYDPCKASLSHPWHPTRWTQLPSKNR